jgi:hypothetical protein
MGNGRLWFWVGIAWLLLVVAAVSYVLFQGFAP